MTPPQMREPPVAAKPIPPARHDPIELLAPILHELRQIKAETPGKHEQAMSYSGTCAGIFVGVSLLVLMAGGETGLLCLLFSTWWVFWSARQM